MSKNFVDMADDNMIINELMFCSHGHEYCNYCSTDHRVCNDYILADRNGSDKWKALMKEADFNPEYRKPLSITDRIMKIGRQAPDGASGQSQTSVWACKEHIKPDCKTCFNWPRLIREAAKKDRAALDDRAKLLGALESMSVIFPQNTKLPVEMLEKKLTSALNHAQQIATISDKLPINPSQHPVWKDKTSKSIFNAVKRVDLREAYANMASTLSGNGSLSYPLYENAFNDLRQTVMHLAKNFENDHLTFVMEDKDGLEGICGRIVNVHYLSDDMPLIVLFYQPSTSHDPITRIKGFLDANARKGYLTKITSTAEEQALLRRLLYLNSMKLSADYAPKREPYEKDFKLSFVIPVGPIHQVDIGKLTSDPGCVLCGSKTASKCSSCLSVKYCGRECQQAHWKQHKQFCRAVKGGTWCTVKISTEVNVNGQSMQGFSISHSSGGRDARRVTREDGSPPDNVHGERMFLVKLQRPLMGFGAMMVYDRTRSFTAYIDREQGPQAYDAAMRQMPPGGALKIYRWAKRAGDWELSVCLDREPGEIPQW